MSNKEIVEIPGLQRITKKLLQEFCKKDSLYQTPHLNDRLYLHFQGFQTIENLEEYTGLKCLWLESNAISEIQGLENQTELRSLFLHNNLIQKIENLQSCKLLDTLNLSSNHITRIENCGINVLPVLSTLNLSRNYLRTSEALQELVACKNVSCLDLSQNRIDDILVVKIFGSMPELRVLILQGNPVVSRIPQYRKTMILECKKLTFLDNFPVSPKDRACAAAWKRGGFQEEQDELKRWGKKDRRKMRRNINATLRLRKGQGAEDIRLLESTDEEDDYNPPKRREQKFEITAPLDVEIPGIHLSESTNDSLDEAKKDSHTEDSTHSAENSSSTSSAVFLSSETSSTKESENLEKASREENELPSLNSDKNKGIISTKHEENQGPSSNLSDEEKNQLLNQQVATVKSTSDETFPAEGALNKKNINDSESREESLHETKKDSHIEDSSHSGENSSSTSSAVFLSSETSPSKESENLEKASRNDINELPCLNSDKNEGAVSTKHGEGQGPSSTLSNEEECQKVVSKKTFPAEGALNERNINDSESRKESLNEAKKESHSAENSSPTSPTKESETLQKASRDDHNELPSLTSDKNEGDMSIKHEVDQGPSATLSNEEKTSQLVNQQVVSVESTSEEAFPAEEGLNEKSINDSESRKESLNETKKDDTEDSSQSVENSPSTSLAKKLENLELRLPTSEENERVMSTTHGENQGPSSTLSNEEENQQVVSVKNTSEETFPAEGALNEKSINDSESRKESLKKTERESNTEVSKKNQVASVESTSKETFPGEVALNEKSINDSESRKEAPNEAKKESHSAENSSSTSPTKESETLEKASRDDHNELPLLTLDNNEGESVVSTKHEEDQDPSSTLSKEEGNQQVVSVENTSEEAFPAEEGFNEKNINDSENRNDTLNETKKDHHTEDSSQSVENSSSTSLAKKLENLELPLPPSDENERVMSTTHVEDQGPFSTLTNEEENQQFASVKSTSEETFPLEGALNEESINDSESRKESLNETKRESNIEVSSHSSVVHLPSETSLTKETERIEKASRDDQNELPSLTLDKNERVISTTHDEDQDPSSTLSNQEKNELMNQQVDSVLNASEENFPAEGALEEKNFPAKVPSEEISPFPDLERSNDKTDRELLKEICMTSLQNCQETKFQSSESEREFIDEKTLGTEVVLQESKQVNGESDISLASSESIPAQWKTFTVSEPTTSSETSSQVTLSTSLSSEPNNSTFDIKESSTCSSNSIEVIAYDIKEYEELKKSILLESKPPQVLNVNYQLSESHFADNELSFEEMNEFETDEIEKNIQISKQKAKQYIHEKICQNIEKLQYSESDLECYFKNVDTSIKNDSKINSSLDSKDIEDSNFDSKSEEHLSQEKNEEENDTPRKSPAWFNTFLKGLMNLKECDKDPLSQDDSGLPQNDGFTKCSTENVPQKEENKENRNDSCGNVPLKKNETKSEKAKIEDENFAKTKEETDPIKEVSTEEPAKNSFWANRDLRSEDKTASDWLEDYLNEMKEEKEETIQNEDMSNEQTSPKTKCVKGTSVVSWLETNKINKELYLIKELKEKASQKSEEEDAGIITDEDEEEKDSKQEGKEEPWEDLLTELDKLPKKGETKEFDIGVGVDESEYKLFAEVNKNIEDFKKRKEDLEKLVNSMNSKQDPSILLEKMKAVLNTSTESSVKAPPLEDRHKAEFKGEEMNQANSSKTKQSSKTVEEGEILNESNKDTESSGKEAAVEPFKREESIKGISEVEEQALSWWETKLAAARKEASETRAIANEDNPTGVGQCQKAPLEKNLSKDETETSLEKKPTDDETEVLSDKKPSEDQTEAEVILEDIQEPIFDVPPLEESEDEVEIEVKDSNKIIEEITKNIEDFKSRNADFEEPICSVNFKEEQSFLLGNVETVQNTSTESNLKIPPIQDSEETVLQEDDINQMGSPEIKPFSRAVGLLEEGEIVEECREDTESSETKSAVELSKREETMKGNREDEEQDLSWWETTLAAARQEASETRATANEDNTTGDGQFQKDPSEKKPTDDETEVLSEKKPSEDQTEAEVILESILEQSRSKKYPILDVQALEETKDETTISSFENNRLPLREVLSTFNEVVEKIPNRDKKKSKILKNLIENPLTKSISAQTGDEINRQFDEMNRERRQRLSQMIDQVYSQKDKYDDTLEVVDGRLMIVERSTGALLSVPPPSRTAGSTEYTCCGLSTTQTSCNDDSNSDDYGTALSENDDVDDIEQHASDTKIKKILLHKNPPQMSEVGANESLALSSSGSCTKMEREENENSHRDDTHQQFHSKRRVVKLHQEIDAEVPPSSEVSQWLVGEDKTSLRVTVDDNRIVLAKRTSDKEEIMLMGKFSAAMESGSGEGGGGKEYVSELQVELGNSTQTFIDLGEAALEDIALIFELPHNEQ